MSVVYDIQPEDTCQRWDKKLKRYVTVSRPNIICEYNSKMGGFDLVDRMMSYYRMSVRTKKWTLRMLMHFTDLALANSWLLYRKDLTVCGTPKKSIMQFACFAWKWLRYSWPSGTIMYQKMTQTFQSWQTTKTFWNKQKNVQ